MHDEDPNAPETFGDGLPCVKCKGFIDQHDLSDERDSRGRRIWICPTD